MSHGTQPTLDEYVGCVSLPYANDIMLLSLSVQGLQKKVCI